MKKTERSYSEGYQQGYAAGYQAGVEAARNGRIPQEYKSNITELPVDAMDVSTRAKNCLRNIGCRTIADVLALDSLVLARARNLGCKTAKEIAHWLTAQDLPYSAWNQYL